MVIMIDDIELYIKDGIDGIKRTLTPKINKVEGIANTFYQCVGGYTEEISFNAYLVEDRLDILNKLDEIVKTKKVVDFVCFDDFLDCKILITSKTDSPELFTRGAEPKSSIYHAKSVTITGYLINKDSE